MIFVVSWDYCMIIDCYWLNIMGEGFGWKIVCNIGIFWWVRVFWLSDFYFEFKFGGDLGREEKVF